MPTPSPIRVVLTGFMGSGKTTIGRLLAEELRWTFLDLDHEIERQTHRTVPQIFAESGEPHFRRLETETLGSLLHTPRLVLALGGGAPETPATRTLLEQTTGTAIIHLTAPFETLLARCQTQQAQPGATARPNLADPEAAAARFQSRQSLYINLATHTLDTTTLAPQEAATALARTLAIPAPPAKDTQTPATLQ